MQSHYRRMQQWVWLNVLGVLCFGAQAMESRAADEKPPAKATITSLPKIPAEIHQALQDRDFAEAVKLVDEAVAKPNSPADYLLYLKGRAQTELKQYDAALTTFLQLEKDHPKSRWLARSRFGRAEVFQRKRDYRTAGEIYKTEADRLLSDGRRDELTEIYLEFANRYFEGVPIAGPTSEKKPEYQLALTYFQQSLTLRPSRKVRQETELKIARCHQELGQHDQAIAAYEKFLNDYGSAKAEDSRQASAELEIEARYQLGKTQLAKGLNAEARRTWQDFLRSPLAQKAKPDRIAQVTYDLAKTHGIPTPGSQSAMERGVQALETFLEKFPEHKLAEEAQVEIAQAYIHFRRYDRAIERLNLLIKAGGKEDEESIAQARRLLGESYFAQKKFTEAIAAWREFLDEHPAHPTWSAVQRQVIDAEFQRAEEARQDKNYAEARKLWSTFLNKYPLDERASLILLRFGQMNLAEGIACQKDSKDKEKARPAGECEKLFESAIADWKRLAQKYPGTEHASEGSYLIGVTLEDHLGRLSEALEAYKQVAGSYLANARQRIAHLTAKQLEVVTERKFLSSEEPEIVVTTRNLESVQVKMYRIDMADYFRKMHLATGVETLDIALIDPDKTWEHKIEGYEKYRRFTNRVPIPKNGPGVTAVTISSDKQEATTMVIVSDIDIIVKSSRNELFVFAENMRTQKPAPGVSVLVSDGEKVFAEEITGEDGVLKKSYDELKTAEDLRVFAIHEGHAASTVTSLSGLEFAVGLSPKGYLYTDRPAYRAGEVVHLKGIVRWVDEDQFTFKPGEKYTLDIYDSRGRVIHTKPVELGEFGTFSLNTTLPETSPQGDYRVHLHQPGQSQSYETSFQVHETRLEPVQIVVDLDQNIVHRGEKITGKITLKYYYGTPLANRPVRYQLAGGRWHDATTDAKGQVAFEFETEPFSETEQVALTVHFPERNLQTAASVYVVTEGFSLSLETLRKVFIAGEAFDVTLKAKDAAGKPVATELTLEVFERTRVESKTGERLVSTHPLKTDEKTGEARQTLKLDNSGIYLLRASATDRFGNRITGAAAVKISGADDDIRLRILVEKQYYKVGDEAKLTLHWREDPALALLTYEGAKILGYRLVELKNGANAVMIPMEAKLAPNFRLSAAVMHKNRFHATQTDFLVGRELQVALKPDKTTLKPGDELALDLAITDPQGRPISAELSLALIEKNLLEHFGGGAAPIHEVYVGARRPAMRVQSSTTFEYKPRARGISELLLAEEERQEILARELAALRGFSNGERFRFEAAPGTETDQDEAIRALIEARDAPAPGQPGSPASTEGILLFSDGVANTMEYRELNDLLKTQNGPAASQQNASGLGLEGQQQLGANAMGGYALGQPPKEDAEAAPNLYLPATQLKSGLEKASGQNENLSSFYTELNRGLANAAPREQRLYLQELSQMDGTIIGLNRWGEMQVVNGLPLARLEELTKAGLQMLPGMGTAETGYWNPVIITDKEGKARITFRMPERSTAWQLKSRAVTKDTLTGEADVEIITKKELFGEIKAPLAFMEGDKANVIVEVHNAVIAKGETINVIFQAKQGEKTTELRKAIVSNGPGIEEVQFPVALDGAGELELSLAVESGDQKDATTANVPVEPFGLPVYATAAGTSAQNTIAIVSFGKDTPAENQQMEILVGPTINRALVDAILGSEAPRFGASLAPPGNRFERAISDVLGGTAVLAMLQNSQTKNNPDAEALAGRVRSGIASLVSSQREDGGWSWSGQPGANSSDRYLSSRAVWALAEARKAGFAVPQDTWNKAVQHLKSAFTSSRQSDREGQAILLHGLAMADAGDFAFANRLYRERNSLSPSGLLHLALALIELDRKSMAEDLLKLIELPVELAGANSQQIDIFARRCIPWMQSNVELRALYLLALEEVTIAGTNPGQLASWLMAARQGLRWTPEKVNGPTIVALARWYGRERQTAEKYQLEVFVNNQRVELLEIKPEDGSHRLSVPAEFFNKEGKQTVNFDITGRGQFSYSVVMSGFLPADKLKGTTEDWWVRRHYEPAQRMFDGQPVPRGFDVLTGSYKTFRNPLTQLPLGERGDVTIDFGRRNVTGSPDEAFDYLVITEPVPAGTMVLSESITGNFERYEISPGAITFYLGDGPRSSTIRYQLVGYLPGEYRALPTIARSFYRPDRMAISETKSLSVLNRGEKSKDEYQLSPLELYELGRRHFEKQNYPQADDQLTKLFRNHRLNAETYKNAVQMLFRTSLELSRDQYVVEYFEIIKEKYPDVEIDFDNILRVAGAYRELGEYERSFLVYRATVEARFERESQISGFLKGQDEHLDSFAVMERLFQEYPAESYIATATYALAGEVYGIAESAAGSEKLKKAGVTRVDLIAANIHMLDHFLSTWPNDPAADTAAFSMANSYLDLEQFESAINRSHKFAERYPESKLVDSFWYVIGYSQFALGKHQDALKTCEKVAEAKRKDPATGLEVASANKWEAIYIMGQIYHSLGQPAKAIDEYEKVDERFPDADEAIHFFTRKEISLPEVSTIRPKDPKTVTLKYRNIESAQVKVYRIDLMKFGLMQRNLDRITAINLAGIKPYHELTLDLGNGRDYQDREKPLALPLKEEGAYLVVCRGENLYASGLVLISPFALEVQEDAVSGRVRVTVKNAVTDQYAADVHVKTIGSSNAQFVSGETDLRGIFIADDIQGTTTVIARQQPNLYAFYRGEKVLGQVPNAEPAAQTPADPKPTAPQGGKLLEQIRGDNYRLNQSQRQQWDNLINNSIQGVKAKGAY